MFVFQLPPTYRNLFGSEFLGGAPTSICDFVLRVFVFPFVPKSKNVYSICYDVYGGGDRLYTRGGGRTLYKRGTDSIQGGETDTIQGGEGYYTMGGRTLYKGRGGRTLYKGDGYYTRGDRHSTKRGLTINNGRGDGHYTRRTRTDNIQGKDRYYACRQIECAHPPVFLSYV